VSGVRFELDSGFPFRSSTMVRFEPSAPRFTSLLIHIVVV